jgi:signal recognition particle GTPase
MQEKLAANTMTQSAAITRKSDIVIIDTAGRLPPGG